MKKILLITGISVLLSFNTRGQTPIITRIEPASAIPGNEVSIFGYNIDATAGNNTVTINGESASVNSVVGNSMKVTVPTTDAGICDAILTNPNGTSNTLVFTVLSSPSPGLYTSDSTVSTPNGPYGMFAADIDGDGHNDLIAAVLNEDKIVWYHNNGDKTFGNEYIISSSVDGPRKVIAVDLDNDNDLDVISASINDDKIAWFENNGSGVFSTPASSIINSNADGAQWVEAGDLDGDGDMDLVSASKNDDKVAWYENNGNKTFSTEKVITSSLNGVMTLSIADIDGDGLLDIVAASVEGVSSDLIWYKNNGNDTFSGTIIDISSQGSRSLFSADLDNDGDMDILSAAYRAGGNYLFWYENRGNGGFTYSTKETIDESGLSTMVFQQPYSVYASDQDGDGDQDVLLAIGGDDKIVWYENNGDKTFSDQVVISSSTNYPLCVITSDLDADGDLDVISSALNGDKISWYENNFVPKLTHIETNASIPGNEIYIYGSNLDPASNLVRFDGVEATINIAESTTSYLNVTVPDIDVGVANVIISSPSGYSNPTPVSNFTILNDNAPCTFKYRTIEIPSQSSSSVFSADLDADGDMDVLVAKGGLNKISWYENDGNKGFSVEKVITSSASSAMDVYASDLNGDGLLDVLSASASDDKIAWYKNNGDKTFTTQPAITTSANAANSVMASDLDGDGDMDVISTSENDDKVAWYENDGQGSFSSEKKLSIAIVNAAATACTADVDRDGDMDVLSSAIAFDERIIWYENNNDGTFSSEKIVVNGRSSKSLVAVDVNGSGNMDVISGKSYLEWYENNGNETFSSENLISSSFGQIYTVHSNDLNGDGYDDVLKADWTYGISLFENVDGLGNFGSEIKLNNSGATSVYAADIDDDGDLDVISTHGNDKYISWLENIWKENDITSFSMSQQTGPAELNTTSHEVNIEVTADTDVTGLIPTIGISTEATLSPESGIAQDFTSPFIYTVTAEYDALVQDWTVNVIAIPIAPVLVIDAVDQTTADLSWNVPSYTEDFKLEVSNNSDFTSLVSGYDPEILDNATTNVTVTGLSAGNIYYARIRSVNINDSESVNSNTIEISLKPETPVLNSPSGVQQAQFSISWPACTGATGYEVDVSSDNFVTLLPAYDSLSEAGIFLDITGLETGTNYQVRVRSVNASGLSLNSNIMDTLTISGTPVLNSIEKTDIEQTSVLIDWPDVAGVINDYLVDVSTTDYATAATLLPGYPITVDKVNTSINIGIDAGTGTLNSGTRYWFRLRTRNNSGESGNSNYYGVITIPMDPTAQPAAGITENSFQATWNSVTGADFYIVEVSDDDFSSLVDRDSLTNQLFLDVTGLTDDTEYKYRVQAGNVSGLSDYSNAVTVTTLVNPISEPTSQPTGISFSGVTPSSTMVSFTSAAGNPAGYLGILKAGSSPTEVPVDGTNYSVGNALGTCTIAYIGSNNSFTANSLNAGTEYYFSIFSYNGATGTYNYLTTGPLTGSQFTSAGEPSAQATNMTFSNVTVQSFTVLFTAAAGNPSGYIVLQRAGSSPGDLPVDGTEYTAGDAIGSSTVAYFGSGTNFSVSGLSPGSTYYYDVFSYNGSTGNYNYLTSSPLEGNQITIPGPPDPSTSTISQESFDVNWSAVTGADSYVIDVSIDSFISFVDGYQDKSLGDVLTTTISGLSPGISYDYRMRTVNTAGTSVNSDTLSVLTVPGTPVLNIPTDVGQEGFTINWNSIVGTSGYRIDVSEDEFFTNLPAYNNKSVSDTTLIVTGLTAGNNYDIRMRSENTSGISPNSTTIAQELIPATPVAAQAGNVQSTSFVAAWAASNGADQYELDVTKSTDNFSENLTGFDALVITDLSQVVSGLSTGQEYKFRVRASNATGLSPNSNEITVTPIGGSVANLVLVDPGYNSQFMAGDASDTIRITVRDGVPPYEVEVKYKGILDDSYESGSAEGTGGSFSFTIQETMLDVLGLMFYVIATDDVDSTHQSNVYTIKRGFDLENSPLLPTMTGGEPKDYKIISIPYVLQDNDIVDIFSDFGVYDKEVWRLIHWKNGVYVDHPGVTKIELGKGYWFNSRKTDIESVVIGAGSVNTQIPFTMRLDTGWNQIGNPYHISVSWNNVRANNNVTDVVDVLRVFDPNAANKFKDGDALSPFQGGFVWSDQSVDVEVHPSRDAGARIAKSEITDQNIDGTAWTTPFKLVKNNEQFNLGGIGMHMEAMDLKDRFDKMALPRFMEYTEWFTVRDDYFYPWFSTDVVPTQNEYRWTFNVESNVVHGNVSLNWDQRAIENTISQLWLIDEEQAMVTDMKVVGNYNFNFDGTHEFSIFYSRDPESMLIPSSLALGNAYPNPVTTSTIIPVILPQMKEQYLLELAIYDLTGKKVKVISNKVYNPGYHQFTWNGYDDSGNQMSPGVYIYRLSFNDKNLGTYQKKLVLSP